MANYQRDYEARAAEALPVLEKVVELHSAEYDPDHSPAVAEAWLALADARRRRAPDPRFTQEHFFNLAAARARRAVGASDDRGQPLGRMIWTTVTFGPDVAEVLLATVADTPPAIRFSDSASRTKAVLTEPPPCGFVG